MPIRLLTIDEVVDRLHEAGLTDLTRRWVQDQINRGILPAVVIARRRRVRQDRVEEMITTWVRKAA